METTLLPEHSTAEQTFDEITAAASRSGAGKKLIEQEWAPAFFFFVCDVICWFVLYGTLGFIRHDALFSSGFEFAVIDLIQLAVIVQALFIVGGYSSRVEMRGLT